MYRVLVADDEKDVVSLLKDFLELKGYCVYTANNGNDLLTVYHTFPPPAVLPSFFLKYNKLFKQLYHIL